jgi:hypothetical protein
MTNSADSELSLADIPDLDAEWPEIARFAGSFNAWQALGPEETHQIVIQRRSESISDLRARLFVHKRACTHSGSSPSAEAMREIREILVALRQLVSRNDPLGAKR